MKIIGLTGRSGSGKGEVCKIFAANHGVQSIDTDKIARELMGKGGVCLAELVEQFSGMILDECGELDRKKLADIVFEDKAKLALLNKITHRYIIEECANRAEAMREAGAGIIIVDAPLLFESGFDVECDIIISVIAEENARLERIIKRDAISLAQAARRLENQQSDDFFAGNSNLVIYNNGLIKDIERQLADIISKI